MRRGAEDRDGMHVTVKGGNTARAHFYKVIPLLSTGLWVNGHIWNDNKIKCRPLNASRWMCVFTDIFVYFGLSLCVSASVCVYKDVLFHGWFLSSQHLNTSFHNYHLKPVTGKKGRKGRGQREREKQRNSYYRRMRWSERMRKHAKSTRSDLERWINTCINLPWKKV